MRKRAFLERAKSMVSSSWMATETRRERFRSEMICWIDCWARVGEKRRCLEGWRAMTR